MPVGKIGELEKAYHEFMAANHAGVLSTIMTSGDLDEATEESLKKAIDEFLGSVAY